MAFTIQSIAAALIALSSWSAPTPRPAIGRSALILPAMMDMMPMPGNAPMQQVQGGVQMPGREDQRPMGPPGGMQMGPPGQAPLMAPPVRPPGSMVPPGRAQPPMGPTPQQGQMTMEQMPQQGQVQMPMMGCGMMAMMMQNMTRMGAGNMAPMPGAGGVAPSAASTGSSAVRLEGRIAYLRTELRINDAQAQAWDTFTASLRQGREHLDAARAALEESASTADPLARLEAYESHLRERSDAIHMTRMAFNTLYAQLDESQKRIATATMLPFIGAY